MQIGLHAKFIVLISALMLAFGAAVTVITVRVEEEILRQRLSEKARAMASLLGTTAPNLFVSLDVKSLRLLLVDVLAQEEVLYAYAFDGDGRVMAAGVNTEKFRHRILGDPVSREAAAATTVLMQFGPDFLDVTHPVYLGDRKLGGIRLGFTLRRMQAEIAATRNKSIAVGAGFGLCGILLSAMLVQTIVRPLARLVEGTERISRGEFDRRVEIRTRDELEILAQAFNQMTESLRRAAEVERGQTEELRAGRERLAALSRRLVQVQEDERRRVAHELREEVAQSLTALRLNLLVLQRMAEDPALAQRLDENVGVVGRLLEQIRVLSLGLRPAGLDVLGLLPALRSYADRQAHRAGFTVRVETNLPDPPERRYPTEIETTCFRVAQEALDNVARHAWARQVRIDLRQGPGELWLVIGDDGVGFDVEAVRERASQGASLGLLSMQEGTLLVGGTLDIDSAPSRGTTVRARFPLSSLPSPDGRPTVGERRLT